MPTKNIPKSFFVEMDPGNKKWFTEYKRWKKTKKNYHRSLERFLTFQSNIKPFNIMDNPDVEKFRDEMEHYGIKKTPFIIYVLKDFKNFLVSEKGVKDDFLNNVSELAKATSANRSSKAVALNLAQIGCIRKYNREKGDINDEYIFEIFFQLGIEKNQLKLCHPQYKVDSEKCFVHNDKSIPYNETIAELLEKVEDNEQLSLRFQDVDTYLKKVTEYLKKPELKLYRQKRQIRRNDLKATHEAHFIKCPNCHRLFENVEKNWVLAKIEGGKEFYVVCAQCRGEPQNERGNNEN